MFTCLTVTDKNTNIIVAAGAGADYNKEKAAVYVFTSASNS